MHGMSLGIVSSLLLTIASLILWANAVRICPKEVKVREENNVIVVCVFSKQRDNVLELLNVVVRESNYGRTFYLHLLLCPL